jgi:hypothetical protein
MVLETWFRFVKSILIGVPKFVGFSLHMEYTSIFFLRLARLLYVPAVRLPRSLEVSRFTTRVSKELGVGLPLLLWVSTTIRCGRTS